MKVHGLSKKFLLPACAAGLVALACASAFAGEEVTFSPVRPDSTAGQAPPANPDNPSLMREYLWEGSFDRAGDATRAVETKLNGGLDFNCEKYRTGIEGTADQPPLKPDPRAYQACRYRQQQAEAAGAHATSIRQQQRVFSDISKVSDIAAVGAVGATITSELAMKNNSQVSSYEKAARIQKVAGQANYAAGATDLVLGATAFISQKNRLEQMKRELNAPINGYNSDAGQLNSSLTNAIEQSKQAAYSHMLYGAGKMAAGYASIWASKRTARQAENLASIEMSQYEMAAMPRPAQPATQYVVVGNNTPPAYLNNTPSFIYPNTSPGSGNNTSPPPLASYPTANAGGTGSSAAPATAVGSRALASSGAGGRGGLSAAAGGMGGGSGSSSAPPATNEEKEKEKEKEAKEAVGNSFDIALTGGVRNSFGHSGDSPGGADSPNLGALLGNIAGDGKNASNTNISPNQVYQEATQGLDGNEQQGSMSGVNGRNETSLFDIMRTKITKMIEVGNVGASKTVEVKN